VTPKQARFVEEYLLDLNATQAAIRAGYSRKRAGARGYLLMRHPDVAAAVTAAQHERSRRTAITAGQVLIELARIAFADLRDFVEWDDTKIEILSSKDLSTDAARAVAEVTYSKSGGATKVKLHDKKAALEALARHLGLFKDRIEVSAPDDAAPAVLNVYVVHGPPPPP
jgi:phage terminase small subunit